MGWTGELREFRQTGREKPLIWRIQVEDATETIWHGVLGGKQQKTSHTYSGVNIGKSNEVSPRVYALDRAERKILMKEREGYLEYKNGKPGIQRGDAILPGRELPLNLAFYKPDNSLSVHLLKLARAGEALFGRKRNGMMYVIRTLEDDVELYSRRMLRGMHLETQTWEERFGHLYSEVLSMLMEGTIPPHSLILGELVSDRRGQDDFTHVQSVTKAKTDKALEYQKKGGYLAFYVWDIAQWDGELILGEWTNEDRLNLVMKVFEGRDHLMPIDLWDAEDVWSVGKEAVLARHPGWIFRKQRSQYPYKACFSSEDDKEGRTYSIDELAQEVAKYKEWEGWVVVDPKGVLGDRSMNFRGKPDRPGQFSGKLKPEWEDDFIAEWDPEGGDGSYGTGKNQGMVGSMALYQLNSAGDPVYISDVSGGIRTKYGKDYTTGPLREDLSDKNAYPIVVEVTYAERTYISDGDKTNALMFARITRFRDDKDPEECINPKL
jgi:hypothetical protein